MLSPFTHDAHTCKHVRALSEHPGSDNVTPQSSVPQQGANVTLQCRVGKDKAYASKGVSVAYVWTKDQSPTPIPPNSGVDGGLTLTDVQTSDNGNYMCFVHLSVGGNSAPPLVVLIGSALVTVGGG